MPVYHLGGKDIKVDTYEIWWPLSIFYKKQGLEIKVNPERHWWCLWFCTTTDDVAEIDCQIVLITALEENQSVNGSCTNCGDLVVAAPGSYGISAPWLYSRVDYRGVVRINSTPYSFEGMLLYT
jgi:hypothetical protein